MNGNSTRKQMYENYKRQVILKTDIEKEEIMWKGYKIGNAENISI